MQWFIRPGTGGATWLRLIFWLEDRFPRFFGEHGQYPLIVIHKDRRRRFGAALRCSQRSADYRRQCALRGRNGLE